MPSYSWCSSHTRLLAASWIPLLLVTFTMHTKSSSTWSCLRREPQRGTTQWPERLESFTWISQLWGRETEQMDACQHLPAHLPLFAPSPHLLWAESPSPGPPPKGPRELAYEGFTLRGGSVKEPEGEVKLRVQASLFIHEDFALHTLPLSLCLLSPSSGRAEVCCVHGVTTALSPPLSTHRKHCLVPAGRVHHPAESKPTDQAWSAWELSDL